MPFAQKRCHFFMTRVLFYIFTLTTVYYCWKKQAIALNIATVSCKINSRVSLSSFVFLSMQNMQIISGKYAKHFANMLAQTSIFLFKVVVVHVCRRWCTVFSRSATSNLLSVSHFATYFLLPLPYALLLTTVHQQRFYVSKSFVFYATRYDLRMSKKRAKLNRPTSVQKTDLPKISSFLLGFIVQRKYRCPARIFPIDLPSSRGHVTKRTRKLRGDARLHQPRTIDDRKSSFLWKSMRK